MVLPQTETIPISTMQSLKSYIFLIGITVVKCGSGLHSANFLAFHLCGTQVRIPLGPKQTYGLHSHQSLPVYLSGGSPSYISNWPLYLLYTGYASNNYYRCIWGILGFIYITCRKINYNYIFNNLVNNQINNVCISSNYLEWTKKNLLERDLNLQPLGCRTVALPNIKQPGKPEVTGSHPTLVKFSWFTLDDELITTIIIINWNVQ